MGVPSYFAYLVKNHPDLLLKWTASLMKIDHLYLDCNSLIYDAVYAMEPSIPHDQREDHILRSVVHSIQRLVQLLQPKRRLFIAFDGVAPVAKLEQQRNRRFKSMYQTSLEKALGHTSSTDPWNTTAITPGTLFMKRLDQTVSEAFQLPHLYGVDEILFSGTGDCGEGEHKLFQHIRNHPDDCTTVIYGLDADLIMLSIHHLPVCPHIYLFRETPHFIQSIHAELEPHAHYMLDIPALATRIAMEMNLGEEQDHQLRIYDYIFLCFFLGNDFMPHFPAINIRTGGIDKLMLAYKATLRTGEYLTNGRTIYWNHLRRLVQKLAEQEETFLKQEHKLRDRQERRVLPETTPKEKLERMNVLPTLERGVEKFINPFRTHWQNRYYEALFHLEINTARKRQICMNYLEGLEWTLKYYTTGCPDWKWSYRYAYPPLLSDLLHYIPFFETELVPQQPSSPVHPLVQLAYVLPKQSLYLLPYPLYELLLREKTAWYPSSIAHNNHFQWAYCKYFWESHPNLPPINLLDLEDIVRRSTHISCGK